jgi:haloalkane dehalogenase
MNRRQFLTSATLSAVGISVIARGTAGSATSQGEADVAAARRYNRERRFLDTDFGRIAYIDRGTGQPTLFLHGFPLSSFQWRGMIERLADSRRCLAPDTMGLGYTEVAPGQGVTPADQVRMLTTFLDRLSIAKVDVIANDSGGAIAQLFLVAHPERVRSLLLTNCDVEPDSPPAAVLPIIDLARSGTYPELYLEPWLHHKDVARSPTGLGGMCYSNPGHPTDAALEQYLGPLVASPARKALVNRYTLGLSPNPLQGITARLRECTTPTRIVWGMSDSIFSPQSPDYLARTLPRVLGIRRIPEAKLFFPEEYPQVMVEEARLLWGEDSASTACSGQEQEITVPRRSRALAGTPGTSRAGGAEFGRATRPREIA